jgi:hypothetical protein
MKGIPIVEIAEKAGMTRVAAKQRIYQRDIKPIGYIGQISLYDEEVIELIKEPLPRGKLSPKWGKKRQIADNQ